ncbi:MAG: hypothetical protein AABO58_16385 [Acidobacteriota bacterium]
MRRRAFVCAFFVAAAAFAQSPPIARLITTSGEGDATITGAAGAVAPNADVLCETMETGHYTIVRAFPDGSFRATLFAPPGTSILVKSDAAQTLLQQIVALPPLIDFHLNQLISLPGTIVRRDDPPGEAGEIGFGSAMVVVDGDKFAPVTVRGSLNRMAFKNGDDLTVRVNVTAHGVALKGSSPNFRINLALTPLAGPDGSTRHAQNSFCSTFMTPTGLPVERQQWLYTYYQSFTTAAPILTAADATAELRATLPIRADLPPGYYRPAIGLLFDVTPQRTLQGERITTFIDTTTRGLSIYLPVIRVGEPAAPRLPLALLMNDVVEAARGATAIEDRGRFALAPHIITAAQRMIVPRVDATTGALLRYSLEPFAPTLAIGDRGAPPAPPLIPLRYPSGSLRVTIRAPGGAATTLGPLPFQQPMLIGPSHDGNSMEGGGYITDPLQLSTLDPQFRIAFAADGVHRVEVDASVDDIWGNRWRGGGTYEIDVARPLVVDPSPIPGTPFEVGDAFAFRAALQPPVAGDVDVTLRFAPRSRANEMVEWRASGRANRFGQIALPSSFRFQQPGEYRVDVVASYTDAGGVRHSAAMTWGGVVAPRNSSIVAHGRRGTDSQRENRQAWFFRTQTGETFGRGHVQVPFHSGDVMWMEDGDAAVPNISFQDLQGTVVPILNRYCCGPKGDDAAGETPPFSANLAPRLDVHLSPGDPDIVGYSYAAVERPMVRIREIVGEQGVTAPYWRFNDLYGLQRGTGNKGDLPNDFKFQFGGVVLRGSAIGEPLYAIYASLFVLVPTPDPGGGTRIFPPFRSDGGPLFTLKGKPVDLFFHPTAVRPGTILVQGDTASFAGYSAPTLPSKIAIDVTSPSGRVRTIKGQANKIGYFHDPGYDFAADEPGVWRAKVAIAFDGATSAGQLTAPFPSAETTFNFYVVRGDAAQLSVAAPAPGAGQPGAAAPTQFIVIPPPGLNDLQLAYTATMPGFVLEEGTTATPAYIYDGQRLAADFPNLEPGVDAITISLLLSGTDTAGKRQHLARQVVLQGDELQMPEQKALPATSRRRSVR